MATITALYAAILAIIIVALGINVTVYRTKLQVSLGDGGKPEMLRMVRMHGNAVEYVPLALALMLIYEINGGFHWLLHGVGIALVIGRLLQTWGMWTSDIPGFGRGAGQTLTWLSVAVLAAANILRVL